MRSRRLQLSSFKFKLVAYFVLLSLVPMAATYWGFSTVAGSGESRQVTLRQEAGLRAALALYAERANRAQEQAEQFARSRPLQRALERSDRRMLRRIVAGEPSLYVVGARGLRAGAAPRRAARFPVDVVTGTHRLGEVVATIPLDGSLVARLRRDAAFDSGDVLVLLEGTRIVSASPFVSGRVPVAAGRSATISVGGTRYRTFVAPALPRVGARLAVLTPKALSEAASARTRDRLLAGLLACLALVGVVAYLQGERSSAISAASRRPPAGLRMGASRARPVGGGTSSQRSARAQRDGRAARGAARRARGGTRSRARGARSPREALAATHDARSSSASSRRPLSRQRPRAAAGSCPPTVPSSSAGMRTVTANG